MNRIKIDKGKKEEMRKKVVSYFHSERDDDLGDLASQLIVDFFIEELGPYIYNQGVEDAYVYTKDKAEDMLALQIYRR
ncbi:DUF2164 domain-containing protein [Tissierella sp. Yu-01]|uniref:DUF2164 domain-containing protein n=1 Tax=Tissierella sp. Yu-01 TaxID=3035694 RepID=UPI00240DF4DC|nr:DUF2164 domain-containing protein [Tissierella sp. Yu-01]WFA07704.1 DUF2164 domain-containing protein [Tissierella sp. Yu-01]